MAEGWTKKHGDKLVRGLECQTLPCLYLFTLPQPSPDGLDKACTLFNAKFLLFTVMNCDVLNTWKEVRIQWCYKTSEPGCLVEHQICAADIEKTWACVNLCAWGLSSQYVKRLRVSVSVQPKRSRKPAADKNAEKTVTVGAATKKAPAPKKACPALNQPLPKQCC